MSVRIQGPAFCRYRKLLHHLATGFCVPPPLWNQHGGAFTRLHFLAPHLSILRMLLMLTLPIIHMHEHTKTEVTDVLSLCRNTSKHIKKNVGVEFSDRSTIIATGRQIENTQERKVHRRSSAGAVRDKGCRITGRPWGPEQVICLKHDRTEHTLTWQMYTVSSHPVGCLAPFLFFTSMDACTYTLCTEELHRMCTYASKMNPYLIWQVCAAEELGSQNFKRRSIGTITEWSLREED